MFEVYLAWTALLRILLHTRASLLLALSTLITLKSFVFFSFCWYLNKLSVWLKALVYFWVWFWNIQNGKGAGVGGGVGTADLLIGFQSWSHHKPSDLSAQELVFSPTSPNFYPHPLPCLFQPSTPTYHMGRKKHSPTFFSFSFEFSSSLTSTFLHKTGNTTPLK